MKKKWTISVILTTVIALITIVNVFAGASFDYGELAGTPPEGAVNWVAWHEGVEISDDHPWELLTEDNTNFELGEDLGYSNFDNDPDIEWWIQIEHFLDLPTSNQYVQEEIYLLFGGLDETYSGTLWKQTIPQWIITESASYWGVAPVISTGPLNACPSISEQPVLEPVGERTINFSGPKSGATYHIYRSRNGSGAGNDASNGQYFYISTVTVPVGEYGSFYTDTDVFNGPAWYLVIEADSETNAIIGCHSEEADPTNVVMGKFTAVYDDQKSAVVLEWETVNETKVIGFNVFRGINDTLSDSVKINTEEIAAKHPGSPVGDTYTFEDDGVDDGQTYFYWIEILIDDSSDQTVGPESVTIPEVEWFYYFLPLLFN